LKEGYEKLIKSLRHLDSLYETFLKEENYEKKEDYENYNRHLEKFKEVLSHSEVELFEQLYNEKDRQMILADILEYIFLSRGLFFLTSGSTKQETKKRKKGLFIKSVLYFVNMLMDYEVMTVDNTLRKKFLEELGRSIHEIKDEEHFDNLSNFSGTVGLHKDDCDAPRELNKYFDKLLPKTAGGLWHELLVYLFLLRYDLGYIIPLLLQQKLFSGSGVLTPPDFLIITSNKDIYGIEVGTKKEIQSGLFSLKTNIPTATIDTENSRCSDRCPICKKWIQFCDKVIEEYSNMDYKIDKVEIKCLNDCKLFSKQEILNGKCPYTKYKRKKTQMIQHRFTNGYHYHYKCVLEHLSETERTKLIGQKDVTAIKTHYPHYEGLGPLLNK
jgi:hypothetical protein